MNLPADDGLDVVEHVGEVRLLLLELDAPALDAAHVQHVVDEGEQVVAGGEDLRQVLAHLLGVVRVGRGQRGEADDGVHRRADVVAHAGEERALGFVGALGGHHGVLQVLIDLALLRAVGEDEDVLFLALHLAAHGDDVEPADVPGDLMDVLAVPFGLPAGLNLREVLEDEDGVLPLHEAVHGVDVHARLRLRDAHQPLDVRADVVDREAVGVEHDEDVVDVA